MTSMLRSEMVTFYKRHLLIEKPRGGEDERDVEDHVDHAGPVHGHVGDVVVLPQDRRDDNLTRKKIIITFSYYDA